MDLRTTLHVLDCHKFLLWLDQYAYMKDIQRASVAPYLG